MKKWVHENIEASQKIEASEANDYEVTVNFGGYIGADEIYNVTATDEAEAFEKAIDFAKEDLSVEDIAEVDEDEWEVTIGFCGFIGVENTYTAYANSEEDAEKSALIDAAYDLEASIED